MPLPQGMALTLNLTLSSDVQHKVCLAVCPPRVVSRMPTAADSTPGSPSLPDEMDLAVVVV